MEKLRNVMNGQILKFQTLWNKHNYINEYFSEETKELHKELLKEEKEMRERPKATVVDNNTVVRNNKYCVYGNPNKNRD